MFPKDGVRNILFLQWWPSLPSSICVRSVKSVLSGHGQTAIWVTRRDVRAYIYIGEGKLRMVSPMPPSVPYYWSFTVEVP